MDSSNLREWLVSNAPAELADDLAAACCSRGKRAGRVLASVPTSKGPRTVGAWRALMGSLAPTRAGLFAMIWADELEREAYDAAEVWLDSVVTRGVYRYRPSLVVEMAGGRPFEFHLQHYHTSDEAIRAAAAAVGIDPAAMGADTE